MNKPQGSWVAIPTPYTKEGKIDYEGFKTIIEFQAKYGTSQLLVMGSAGEVTLLTLEEKKEIVKNVIKMSKGLIPVYFGTGFPSTGEVVEFSQFAEKEGADGLIFTIPPYLLIPQAAAYEHFLTCMKSVSIPVGIYNNPSRVGVNIEPETIEKLAKECSNFIVVKEAMGQVKQLVKTKRALGDRLNILCCDYPGYSIVIPTLGMGGNGLANIGGNIIPEEMAKMARPWTSVEIMEECRELYFKYYPLLEALYWFSNPIVIKAAYKILGLPSGSLRKPYPELKGEKVEQLRKIMDDLGVIEKYGVKK
ncbi:dihydrodipicolinate synthase family protein [Cetobacterium sp. 2A]|uniref:dihydrodipicolinate synthase family protein n=1 Tax=Cetobacterium sp. 2A TaxID=2754723 RepID=UPI00163C77A6|nr:dihydrodipicolinate synthase family protein [Cetobacterium sp. 2A]MBC2854957.1 dihydrodipicolinate synthase family protein [Cetobacterium sp. 2A]